MSENLHIGIDIGSKTIKIVLENDEHTLVYSSYERHLANVKETLQYALETLIRRNGSLCASVGITGSAGMRLADLLGLPFIQEVVATRLATAEMIPEADVAIEIGGEDSKILFLSGGEEYRMNDTCAGGTGGFIDTMAGMLDTNAEGLNYLAHGCQMVYPIASRCAVFAQSDVRPLINEGVRKSDIAGSVFNAVATQCVAGLACGRPIAGKVALLGGPLHFLSALRDAFKEVLSLKDDDFIVPIDAHLFVAFGAARYAWDTPAIDIEALIAALKSACWQETDGSPRLAPLFGDEEELIQFQQRHDSIQVPFQEKGTYEGRAYLGIDSGSTSIKCVLIGEDGQILYHYYKRSAGDLIEAAREMFHKVYRRIPKLPDKTPSINITHATATGYGEEFLKKAFLVDSGEVETVAHMRAAKQLVPEVDCILDIGGQDMKCMFMRNGKLDNVVLNEACSSGCGSLISGFAWSMNVKLADFVNMALGAKNPVNLGTRCTVFMTSRVRHAQKEGANIGDISAGLAYSIVKNALFKVMRIRDVSALGTHIVVQGGAFKSDAVLRAFELVCGREVIRPPIAEFMGAYGAALIARERAKNDPAYTSTLLSFEEIKDLKYSQQSSHCKICSNACILVKNTFEICRKNTRETRSFITGNRCERGAGVSSDKTHLPDLSRERNRVLFNRKTLDRTTAPRASVGIIRALRTYEDYAFWHAFFTSLGYSVVLSQTSSQSLYQKGIASIPSESTCYPAKIAHGHVVDLIEKNVDMLFLPYITQQSSYIACPVISSYPLVLSHNIDCVHTSATPVVSPRIAAEYMHSIENDELIDELYAALSIQSKAPTKAEIKDALYVGRDAQAEFEMDMRKLGIETARLMEDEGARGVVISGHPYHADPEINHALTDLLRSFGYAVFTIDSVAGLVDEDSQSIYDTHFEYPAYTQTAVKAVVQRRDLDYLAVYSFGCGIDGTALDDARDYLEEHGRIFTSLKVDEMADLAATRIRVRSMMHAVAASDAFSSYETKQGTEE